MLTNSITLLKDARAHAQCIPAFNIYNLETAQAAFQAARLAQKPVIAAFGEGYQENASLLVIAAIVKTLAGQHPYPVVLHLDHCKEIDTIYRAIDAGFTSVMYDGSRLPLKDNIANTLRVVQYAHERGVGVEGELGCMNPEDGSEMPDSISHSAYTDVNQARRYAKETGVDSLAGAVGNAHGLYKGTPHLHMERLEEIYRAVEIPLVLHGCSGIPAGQIRQAVSIAVAKINVNTELALAGSNQIAALLREKETMRLEKLMLGARERMAEVMKSFFDFA
ncbi:class II fructose-bisphosphate aldolase [Marasmitruncus massiliensis]|uniref:class II fructose-bisphosphate aldolase n=1 Tax=Marasmitruncus massiliensis TaxID=1944642 RepID=UPI000C7D4F86|nr:class II fructose-bisphosphate aldolase [Marasmitruncus massiliensis]